jgi:hypothetical protein
MLDSGRPAMRAALGGFGLEEVESLGEDVVNLRGRGIFIVIVGS